MQYKITDELIIMLKKLQKLQDKGISLTRIEIECGMSRSSLYRVVKTGKYNKTTERKVTDYYLRVIKDLVGEL